MPDTAATSFDPGCSEASKEYVRWQLYSDLSRLAALIDIARENLIQRNYPPELRNSLDRLDALIFAADQLACSMVARMEEGADV